MAGVFGFESGERKARWRGYTEEVSLVSRTGGKAEQKGPTSAAHGFRFRLSCSGHGELSTDSLDTRRASDDQLCRNEILIPYPPAAT